MATKKELRAALERSKTAIDDWLNTYASEFCDEARVSSAIKRIRVHGGTLAYIAGIQEQNRDALKAAEHGYSITSNGETLELCYEEMVEILAAIRDTTHQGAEHFEDAKEKACKFLLDHVPITDY